LKRLKFLATRWYILLALAKQKRHEKKFSRAIGKTTKEGIAHLCRCGRQMSRAMAFIRLSKETKLHTGMRPSKN